jgi:hypothetical protein
MIDDRLFRFGLRCWGDRGSFGLAANQREINQTFILFFDRDKGLLSIAFDQALMTTARSEQSFAREILV